MAATYDVGDLVRVAVTFKNLAGTPTDPTTVIARHRKPDETVVSKTYPTDPEIIKDSTGVFHMDISVTAAGTWHYRWEGTGAIQTSEEGTFIVRTQKVVGA